MLISTASPKELFGALLEFAVSERKMKLSRMARQTSEDIVRLVDMWQATQSRTAASVLGQLGVPLNSLRTPSGPS